MKTVSFQGAQLTAGQRLRLEQQRHVRSFMSPVLSLQVAETIKVLEARKEEGAKPEKVWTLDFECSVTLSIAEFMGY